VGNARFLYNNLITSESMLTVSSLRAGIVTAAKKEGTGSAVITITGSFSGAVDVEYTVEIDSIAGGAEVAQATFRWSDGGGSWDATGVATSAANILLNNGVSIKWTSGSGADFAVGDRWYFKGINLFNAGKMLDRDRDHLYKSAVLETLNTVIVDFGEDKAPKALVAYDHNLSSAAVISLDMDSAATFDSGAGGVPEVSEAVTWNAEKIVHYIAAATSKRYARLGIADATNLAGYIEIGELFLGPYLEMSQNFSEGYSEETAILKDTNTTPYGVERDRFYNLQKIFQFEFEAMPAADVASMETLLAAISSRSAGTFQPLWFNKDSAIPGKTWMVKIGALPTRYRTMDRFDMPLEMREVLKSA